MDSSNTVEISLSDYLEDAHCYYINASNGTFTVLLTGVYSKCCQACLVYAGHIKLLVKQVNANDSSQVVRLAGMLYIL